MDHSKSLKADKLKKQVSGLIAEMFREYHSLNIKRGLKAKKERASLAK